MERRKFINTACGLCAAGWILNSLEGCAPAQPVYKTVVTDKTITVPVSLFAEHSLHLIRVRKIGFDIALRQLEDKTYTATLLRCTHFANDLDVTSYGFLCTNHGSRFTPEGKPTKGPAEKNLKTYFVEVKEDNVVIYI